MLITGNGLHELLIGWLQDGSSRVEIVSPWVSQAGVDLCLRARRQGVEVHLTTRYPEAGEKPSMWCFPGLEALRSEGVLLYYVPPDHGLHAKLYIRDGTEAVVTSANLTEHGLHGARLGEASDARRNLELGVRVDEPLLVEELLARVHKMPRRRWTAAVLAAAADWVGSQPPLEPASPPRRADEGSGLEDAAGLLRDLPGQPEVERSRTGGQRYQITVEGTSRLFAAHSSVWHATGQHSGYYDFEFRQAELGNKDLDGVVFVPVRSRLGALAWGAPVLVIRFDHLRRQLGRDGLRQLFVNAAKPKAYLGLAGGEWRLSLPHLPSFGALELKGGGLLRWTEHTPGDLWNPA